MKFPKTIYYEKIVFGGPILCLSLFKKLCRYIRNKIWGGLLP